MRRLLIVIIFSVLSGCASLDLSQDTPDSLLKKSSLLVNQQRWGEAEELLSEGAQKFPNDIQIQEMLAKIRTDWQTNNQRLEDWILLYETESMLAQRPLLVSLSQSDPDNLILKARLQLHNALLSPKRALLINCAENHQDKEIKLARRCIEAARIINDSPKVQTLLAAIRQKQQGIKMEQVARVKAEQRNTAITKSREYLEKNQYAQVIQLLQPFVIENPDDLEIKVLYQEADAGRDLQILQLISQGDILYRSERTEEALAIWKQAELLDPGFEDLNTRIVRAEKVLKQLQKIKESKDTK